VTSTEFTSPDGVISGTEELADVKSDTEAADDITSMLDSTSGVDGSDASGEDEARGVGDTTTDGMPSGVAEIAAAEDTSSDSETTGLEVVLEESEATGAADRSNDDGMTGFADDTGVGMALVVSKGGSAGEELEDDIADDDTTSETTERRMEVGSTGVD
jgi:hypothetical protein